MFVELRLTVPIIASSAPLLALCGQNGGCETMEKDRAKASLASSMFDTVDSRFLESSRENRIKKKSIFGESGIKQLAHTIHVVGQRPSMPLASDSGPSRFPFISPRRFSRFGENFMREVKRFLLLCP